MATKRWAEPGDLNRCSFRSRRRIVMRVLRPVVCSQTPIVLSREPDRAERCRIGSQPVGHHPARRKAVLLKQFHHEFLAACASRLRWTRKSSTSPSLSTAARASVYRRGSKSPFRRGANDRSGRGQRTRRPNSGGEVILKSQAHVVGDLHHQSLAIGGVPTLMGAQSKSEELMGTSRRELVTSASSGHER